MAIGWREWRIAAAALLLLAAVALKGLLIQPPSVPERVAAGDFDTARALGRLQRILGDQRSHPVDSEANDAVRGRLMAELTAIGTPFSHAPSPAAAEKQSFLSGSNTTAARSRPSCDTATDTP